MKEARADLGKPHCWLPVDSLPPRIADRIRYCRAPIALHGTAYDGAGTPRVARVESLYRCGSRYCEPCARERAQRIYAATLRLVEQRPGAQPVMVTLTIPARHARSDADCVARAVDDLRAAWRAAVLLIHKQERGLQAKRARTRRKWRKAIPAPYPTRRMCTKERWKQYCSEYSSRIGWKGATRDWICVVEVEQNHQHIHAHMHVVCANLATAQRLNAAWQATRPGKAYRQTQVGTRVENRDPTPQDAGRYIAKYVSKPKDAKSLTPAQCTVLYQGLHRRRLVNGSGAWRDLRTRREPNSVLDGIIAVETQDGRIHAPETWWLAQAELLRTAHARATSTQLALEGTGNEVDAPAPVPLGGVPDAYPAGEARTYHAPAWPAERLLEQVTNNVPIRDREEANDGSQEARGVESGNSEQGNRHAPPDRGDVAAHRIYALRVDGDHSTPAGRLAPRGTTVGTTGIAAGYHTGKRS